MTINLETEVIATAFNSKTHIHTYTLQRGKNQWTVSIPDREFAQFGPVIGAQAAVNKANRRRYLATKLEAAMQGDPDAG